MAQITFSRLKEELQNALDKGLTNKEIAETLNEKYGSDGNAELTTNDIRFYKEKVGLKGAKPKRKQFFEIIEDEEEATDSELKVDEYESIGTDGTTAQDLPY